VKILGIDPGTTLLGFGLLVKTPTGFDGVKYGCIRTLPELSAAEQLGEIHKELTKLIKEEKPDVVAVEDLFFFKNAKTVIKVSQARGVVLLAAKLQNKPVCEFTPLQIKQAITGYGRAEKRQVQNMVKIILKLKEIPRPDDAADALAIAVCCANSINLKTKI